MNKELIEELINISNKDKFINRDLIGKFVEDNISKCDPITKNKYSDFWFSRTNMPNAVCTSDPDKGLITIDYSKCLEEAFFYHKEHDSNKLLGNLRILFIIFHEIEHLKEISKMYKGDIESTILKLSSSLAMSKSVEKDLRFIKPILTEEMYFTLQNSFFDKLYAKLYSLDPTEKIADIGSYKYILKGFKDYLEIDDNTKCALNILESEYINRYLEGYTNDENYSPTVKYVSKINSNKSISDSKELKKELIKFKKAINFIGLLSNEEKMRLGLPATFEQRKSLVKSLNDKGQWC